MIGKYKTEAAEFYKSNAGLLTESSFPLSTIVIEAGETKHEINL